MEIKDLLPIGSVVLLNDGQKKVMIIGVKQTEEESGEEFDYSGVLYPEGFVAELGQFLFDHSDIKEIFHKGYEDEERTEFLGRLEEFYANL